MFFLLVRSVFFVTLNSGLRPPPSRPHQSDRRVCSPPGVHKNRLNFWLIQRARSGGNGRKCRCGPCFDGVCNGDQTTVDKCARRYAAFPSVAPEREPMREIWIVHTAAHSLQTDVAARQRQQQQQQQRRANCKQM